MPGERDPGASMAESTLRSGMLPMLQQAGTTCAALTEHGEVVAVPDAVLRLGATPLPFVTDSPLDLFVVDDWPELARQWTVAKVDGAAALTVHRVQEPHVPVRLVLGDFRTEFGVMLAVLQTPAASWDEAPPPPVAPRVCRLREDQNLVVTDADRSAMAMLGWEREELVGRNVLETLHPDDYALVHQVYLSASRNDEYPRLARVRRRRKDGSWLWVETTVRLDTPGDPDAQFDVVLVDISEEMATMAALHEREALLSGLAQALPEGLLQVDGAGQVVFANRQLYAMLHCQPGAGLAEVLSSFAAHDRAVVEASVDSALHGGTAKNLEADLVALTGDGDPDVHRRCRVDIRPVRIDGAGLAGALMCITDITEAVQLRTALEARARQLEDRATFDALTRCHNRESVIGYLETVVCGGPSAVIFVDVDEFKLINDRFGHRAGDMVLAAVGGRLRSTLRAGDMVGRIGGDEFLLVCRDVRCPAEASAIGERVAAALKGAVSIGDRTVDLRCSVGVAFGDGRVGADELVHRADGAMYLSKRGGPDEPVAYDWGPEVPVGPGLRASGSVLPGRSLDGSGAS